MVAEIGSVSIIIASRVTGVARQALASMSAASAWPILKAASSNNRAGKIAIAICRLISRAEALQVSSNLVEVLTLINQYRQLRAQRLVEIVAA